MSVPRRAGARAVLAIDPGRRKCGVAVCMPGRVVARAVVPPEDLPVLVSEWQTRYGVTDAVIGNRTGAAEIAETLAGVLALPLRRVEEAGTTLRARRRYFTEHPPRGWRRLVPRGLLTPPEPYDDYAAVLLAESVLAEPAHAGGAQVSTK